MANQRYFLDSDGDGHSYLIPVEWREEWNQLSENDDAWELDEWQKFEDCRIDSPSQITFELPEPEP